MAEAQLLYSGGRAEVKPNTSHQFKQQEDFLLNRELAAEAGFLKKKKHIVTYHISRACTPKCRKSVVSDVVFSRASCTYLLMPGTSPLFTC